MALRVALFVEAGQDVPPPRGDAPLFTIWGTLLRGALGLRALHPIVPISKKHLLAMDPNNPPMSGAGEGLDQLMARKLAGTEPFDAAIVAWDLIPAWSKDAPLCRWRETLDLYVGLKESQVLPALWREQAARRLEALQGRPRPSARLARPRLTAGTVLPLCMDPMFEGLIVGHEAGARRALGLEGARMAGWPRGWGDPKVTRPDREIVGPAINAVLDHRPRPDVVRKVRGDLRTNKHGWGAHLLAGLLADPEARATVLEHPMCRRLAEIGGEEPPGPGTP